MSQIQSTFSVRAGLLAGGFVITAAVVGAFLSAPLTPTALRWTITIVWLVFTGLLLTADMENDPLGLRRLFPFLFQGNMDKGIFDRWSIAHSGAGIVFGLWYLPLSYVIVATILWEVIEAVTKGIGDGEDFLNRVSDVSVAILGWAVVVIPVALASHAAFPLLLPIHH
jgi:hypothetical protein